MGSMEEGEGGREEAGDGRREGGNGKGTKGGQAGRTEGVMKEWGGMEEGGPCSGGGQAAGGVRVVAPSSSYSKHHRFVERGDCAALWTSVAATACPPAPCPIHLHWNVMIYKDACAFEES